MRITKFESLKAQVERIVGEPVDGQPVEKLLREIDSNETPVYWGLIPIDFLKRTF
jgi:hypothetical protein